ncbi:MAG: hypothetical protein WBK08_17360 [Nitrospira sp.]|jgi:hypothetical protein|nr:MAG: hypothetical protein E8D42_11645 [Nitrospira sp.]
MKRCVPIYKASLLFAGIAGLLLLSGLIYYLAFRTALAVPLDRLHLRPLALGDSVNGSSFLGSLPSLIHVTAFGLLTCSLLRPSLLSAFVAGAAWASLNVLWELSCRDNQAWLRFSSELIGLDSVPTCTYDGGDIVVSVTGVALATYIASLVLKSILSSTIKEQPT